VAADEAPLASAPVLAALAPPMPLDVAADEDALAPVALPPAPTAPLAD
jgi:hypothetical protein